MSENKKYAIITGGSSGIGLEFSKLLGKEGYSLIIVAKPQDELDRAKEWFDKNMPKVSIIYHAQDLAVSNAAKELHDFTSKNGYEVEILINNAGFATFGTFQDIEIERELAMINVLVITNYHLTRLYMNDMIARDSGKILLTSSITAFFPGSLSAAYSASKVFVYYYGMEYSQELKNMGSKVTLTVLCPPATRSGFQHAAGMDDLKMFDKKNKWAYDADFVAEKGYKAMLKGKMKVIPGVKIQLTMKILSELARTRYVTWMKKVSRKISK